MDDVDGDGTGDTFYVGTAETPGARLFGVVTSSGIRSEWTESNAGGADPQILGTADADQDGHSEVFVNPGRHVYVLTFVDCTLQPYLNKDGDAYSFSIGFEDTGTGVGCIDADGDGRRDLVGLNLQDRQGDTVHWTRTIVRLNGIQARNGPTDSGTYTSPADDHAIELLSSVACGNDDFSDPLFEPYP